MRPDGTRRKSEEKFVINALADRGNEVITMEGMLDFMAANCSARSFCRRIK
jgi:hypothetical protein